MATDVLEIAGIPDSVVDDEVRVLYSTTVSVKNGSTKSQAIPVETYRRRSRTMLFIDLSQESWRLDEDEDDVRIIHSTPKTLKRRSYGGECSGSKEPNPRTLIFMCEICADEKPIGDKFRVLGCDHSYCTDCIAMYVSTKLQDNISTIRCPVTECRGYFEPQHCRSILPKQVFDRWGDALCEAVILASERFYCPFKDCSALLIDDGGEVVSAPIVTAECPDCNRLFCAQCKVPWHTGIDCADFQKLSENERSNDDLLLMNLAKSNKWMRCPECKIFVSKTEGCLFMRCRCGHTFCYNCGSPIQELYHYCRICKR